MISGIGGISFVPHAMIDISPQYFYYGDDVIGGYLNLEIKGTHHAEDSDEYTSFIESIVGLIDTCANINFSNECTPASTIDKLDNSVGVVRDARVSPVGGLDINYNIIVECSKDSNKNKLIPNNSDIDFETILGNDMIIRSYSESILVNYTDTSTFSINNTKLVKNAGKFTIQIEVSAYNNDQCDTNDLDFELLMQFLEDRVDAIANSPGEVNISIPSTFVTCATNLKKSLKKTSASINFDLYILPQNNTKAIVEFSETFESDQLKGGQSITKIKGSILGVDSSQTVSNPNYDGYDNASSAYDDISQYFVSGITDIFVSDCTNSSGTGMPNIGDICYQLTNTRLSEFPSANKIDFEMTYKDVETCDLLGYKISSQYEERPAVTGRAEHFAPGRQATYKPLVYASKATSAPKYKLTVNGELPSSCLQQSVGKSSSVLKSDALFSGSSNMDNPITELKTAVSGELSDQKTVWSLTGGNIMKINKIETEGRYTYSITEEYIECQ